MSTNPYENPEFAKHYVMNQLDRSKNMYEWEVTHPATLQFLDGSVDRILDYGCGSGIFTAGLNSSGRLHGNPALESIGTDASSEMTRYATMLGQHTEGVSFQQWDASTEVSPFQPKSFDRIFAKLVLNYVSQEALQETVLPRLREGLADDGLLVAVLPNPLREAAYSKSDYEKLDEIDIHVGNFGEELATHSYHHTYEEMIQAADHAGFAYGRVLGLPEVRFEPYKRRLMQIAHPMPMVLDTLNAAKRWIYVFGATTSSAGNFDNGVQRFENWRAHYYPEIADRAHIRTGVPTGDIDIPINMPHEALYDYVNATRPNDNKLVVLEGNYVEHMTPKQKIAVVKKLARSGVRASVATNDFLVTP